jgi:hypothetical protein
LATYEMPAINMPGRIPEPLKSLPARALQEGNLAALEDDAPPPASSQAAYDRIAMPLEAPGVPRFSGSVGGAAPQLSDAAAPARPSPMRQALLGGLVVLAPLGAELPAVNLTIAPRAIGGVTDDAPLEDWVARHTPLEVAERLQAAGVAAGPMYRPDEVYEHPQLRWRNVLVDMVHPLFDVPLPAETGPAPFRNIPASPHRPAPLPGADTRRVCRDVLGMTEQQTQRLIDSGVLFAADDRQGVPL